MGLGPFIAIICLIIEAVIFLFTIVGTPIDAFRGKVTYMGYRSCYSMWGAKRCGAHKVPSGQVNKGFPCKKTRDTMNAAAAFSIFSLFMTLVTMVMCILLVCKCLTKLVPAILGIVCVITLLIVWACQAGAFHQRCTSMSAKISESMNYAGSFGLFITAWCLQIVNVVLMFLA